MNRSEWNNKMFDVALKLAFVEHQERELQAIETLVESAPPYKISAMFAQKMDRLFARSNRNLRLRNFYQAAKRVAVFLLIMSTVAFGFMMSVSAVRQEVLNTIIELTEKYTSFRFDDETPTQRFETYCPTYLPDGFAETDRLAIMSGYLITYQNENGEQIVFQQYPKDYGLTIHIDTEDGVQTTSSYKGIDVQKFTTNDPTKPNSITWVSADLFFTLAADYDVDELNLIAHSIIEKIS